MTEEITDSGAIETEFKETKDKPQLSHTNEEHKEAVEMFLDSGVCLTDSFSKLTVRGQNDLNVPDKTHTPVDSYSTSKQLDDIPWKIYYAQDEDGDTHLHTAIEEGFVEVTLALIRVAPYPQILDTPNKYGQTPLHLAVASGQWNVARWLIVAGAKPCPRGFEGNSPLHIAALNEDLKCVQAIAHPVQQQERDQLALSYPGHLCQPCDFEQWNYLGECSFLDDPAHPE
ncbi:hypothetical protein JTB14_024191 [Gonioctena quinquepunctata]|nr:hypothetical protein JTB14_024191 [Gonioctena quinquepunctata]